MISKMLRCASLMLAFIATSAGSAPAIINIDANDFNGTSLSLSAGTYRLSYIGIADGGLFDAWSAWAPDGDCGSGPGSCPNGFINELRIEGLSADPLFVGDGFNPIWATAAEALQSAKTNHSPFELFIPTTTTVTFLVGESTNFAPTGTDNPSWQDNSGGLSLTILAVPEPPTVSLLLAVLLAAGAMRLRGRLHVS